MRDIGHRIKMVKDTRDKETMRQGDRVILLTDHSSRGLPKGSVGRFVNKTESNRAMVKFAQSRELCKTVEYGFDEIVKVNEEVK